MPRKGSRSVRKAPGDAVDPRNGQRAALSLIEGGNPLRFDPPKGLGEIAGTQWEEYWTDPVSTLITPADRTLLIRWITTVDRYFTIMKVADAKPVTLGSKMQEIANPLYSLGLKLMDEIFKYEQQLGIGPKNRAALGIAVLTERRSLAQLNQEFEQGGDDEDGGEEQDPRVTVLRGETER